MRLIIRAYLGMLRETREFDALLPDLLLAMNIVPLSKPQVGVRQDGVDIAAVGNDDIGQKTLWLFVLKRGDLGRRDWDTGPQSVRQSLDEIKDVYLRNHVAPEHAKLPVKIVVATTGDFKQEFEQNRVGYADANTRPGRTYGSWHVFKIVRHLLGTQNTQPSRTYEFWNGDRVAALLEQHLLNEYALPDTARSQLRGALALIGEPDYDLEHFFALLNTLLALGPNESSGAEKGEREYLRALVTTSLALGILCRWSHQEGNLRGAVIACERALLWAWDAIRSRRLTQEESIIRGYSRLVDIYMSTTVEYLNKVQPHLHTEDALAVYYRESALLTERVFEEIGIVATIGLCQFLWGLTTQDETRIEGAGAIADTLLAFLKTHRCSGSPCYDGQSIDISLALTLLFLSKRPEHAKTWLKELIGRLTFGFSAGRWFPISTDSFDDLVAFEIERENVDMTKLKETSWMIPTIAQWAAALGEDQAYAYLVSLRLDTLKDTCFQLWYPDQKTGEVMYRGPAHFESGIAEAPVELPPTADEMRASMRKTRTESPVKEPVETSASRAGLVWLDFIASRHFRTPVDPKFWQRLGGELPPSEAPESSRPSNDARLEGETATPGSGLA